MPKYELRGAYADIMKQAEAINESPKVVQWELDHLVVLTGADIPPPPDPEPAV